MVNKALYREYFSLFLSGNVVKNVLSTLLLFKGEENRQILRTIFQNGAFEKLNRTYRDKKVESYCPKINLELKISNPIWFMWLQPLEDAPEFVKANFNYLKRHFGDRVVLVNNENYKSYIDLPTVVIDKFNNKIITPTHFSDIVRFELLYTYGGVWIDSTVLVHGEWLRQLPEEVVLQQYKPGRDGKKIYVSSWFLKFPAGHPFVKRIRDLLYRYWQDNNRLRMYFLVHAFMHIASSEQHNYLQNITPYENAMPHWLMLQMRQTKFSRNDLERVVQAGNIFKFTNKFKNETERKNYKYLVEIVEKL